MIGHMSFQGFEASPFADMAASKAEHRTGQCSNGGNQAGAVARRSNGVIPDTNPQPGRKGGQ
jgi:hypothetical protein